MEGRTYSIIRSSRKNRKTVETVMETGLGWDAADSQRNEIAAAYRAANPLKSSWSGDVFIVQMEPLPVSPKAGQKIEVSLVGELAPTRKEQN